MKSAWLVGGILAAICVVLAAYYLIPGIYHPFTSSAPTSSHLKHVVVFLGLAVVSILGARFAANASKS